jgi:hypothetical protein
MKRMVLFALVGGLLTLLAFSIGAGPWGWIVLAAFVITLVAGLVTRFGVYGLRNAATLYSWFIIAIILAAFYHSSGISSPAWAQTLAWLAGAAGWIVYSTAVWLARGRRDKSQTISALPSDVTPMKLTRPLFTFALLRAIGVTIAVAIAFGLALPNGQWLACGTVAATKPDPEQTTLRSEQRAVAALIGAALASLLLLTISDKLPLELVILVALTLAGPLFLVNYTLFEICIVIALLLAIDLPHPANLANEGERVLYTFIGVGIALVVQRLGYLLVKAPAKPPQAASRTT